MSRATGRLSPEQLENAQKRAEAFQTRLVSKAKGKGTGEEQGSVFFTTLFRLAGEAIETDVDTFCAIADGMFEEIEAHGQEPQLDMDWLGEVIGEKETFNFSTDNLVSDLVSPPRKLRGKKQLSQEEIDKLRAEVEAAILDEGEGETQQNFEQAISVAHSENVQDWIEGIKTALQECDDGILEFWTIQEMTGLRPTELFLGLLLGQEYWEIRQERFYGTVTVEQREREEEGAGQEK